MHVLQAEHPTTPGFILKLFHTRTAAEREGIELLRLIGDEITKGVWSDEKTAQWEEMRTNDDLPFAAVKTFLRGLENFGGRENWYVLIHEKKVEDEAIVIKSAVADAVETGVLAGAKSLADAVQREGRAERLQVALQCALGHISAHVAFISKANRGEFSGCFNFESLNEDMPEMQAALADQPRTVGEIIGGVPMRTQLFAAGTEIHAVLGEAIERHIYDFDNGDTIPDDCQFHAAMRGWVEACAGTLKLPAPASPLPFRVIEEGDENFVSGWLNVIDRVGNEVFHVMSASEADRQNARAMVAAVNALRRPL